ncbi:MAG: fimbria/pilus outer membrane usher protein [Stenotrophomonas maltophilia]|nr:fimbria/pilus outer membrane usher protein [Stenotrophomonas sp.]MCR1003509.1 fimbria/pilus outer membrane usher protein [Stenotrophomonas maltophilia]MCR1571602.1 fimbria/pilus outer membrane usher protein [Stenotrophomonas sp.]
MGVPAAAPRLDTSISRESNGRSTQRVGVSGAIGEQYLGNYNASVSRDGGQTSYDLGAYYQMPTVYVSGGYSRRGSTSQLSMGASGGLVLHAGGLTLAQRLGETVGVVHIPGAAGAALDSMTGVKTDARGYAVLPYLSPFRRNAFDVDPTNLPLDVELSSGTVSAVPNAGAVVRMVLPTQVGRSALIEALLPDGKPLPFGNDVTNEAGDVVGVVGQSSRLWVRGVEEVGELTVRYGSAVSDQCRIPYDLRGVEAGVLHQSSCAPGEERRLVDVTK